MISLGFVKWMTALFMKDNRLF